MCLSQVALGSLFWMVVIMIFKRVSYQSFNRCTDNCKNEFQGRKRLPVPKVTANNSPLLTWNDKSETNKMAMKRAFPNTQCWDQPCLVSLLTAFMRGSSTPSASSQIPSLVGLLICWRAGGFCRGICTAEPINRLRPIVWDSIRWTAGSCPCITTAQCSTTG